MDSGHSMMDVWFSIHIIVTTSFIKKRRRRNEMHVQNSVIDWVASVYRMTIRAFMLFEFVWLFLKANIAGKLNEMAIFLPTQKRIFIRSTHVLLCMRSHAYYISSRNFRLLIPTYIFSIANPPLERKTIMYNETNWSGVGCVLLNKMKKYTSYVLPQVAELTAIATNGNFMAFRYCLIRHLYQIVQLRFDHVHFIKFISESSSICNMNMRSISPHQYSDVLGIILSIDYYLIIIVFRIRISNKGHDWKIAEK